METAKKIAIILKLVHIVCAVGLVILMAFILYRYIDFDGVRVVEHTLDSPHAMVKGLEPQIRWLPVKDKENGWQYWEVLIDPVYVTILPLRRYDSVKIKMVYKADDVPLVQIGGLVDASGWDFAWQGVQFSPIESRIWPCLQDEARGWWLCQKEPQYRSIENFLLAPPNAKILKFNFQLPEGFDRLPISDYTADMDVEEYDYLIADYTPPIVRDDGWYETELEFSFDALDANKDGFQFVLSAPGIHTRGQRVSVRSLVFTFEKEPMTITDVWQKIKDNIL